MRVTAMKRDHRRRVFLWIAIPLLLGAFCTPSPAGAQAGEIAVIGNPNNSIANLTLADLRKIFSGQKRSWPGGAPVKLIVRGPGCRERLALLTVLGMSESEYKQYWTAQVFRGDADAEPLTMPSFGMVKEAVKVYPGAIALVLAQDVKAGMYIRVVKVEGHMPGETGYPLH